MQSEEGRRIHGLAAQAREDGNHLEALKLSDEAMLAYQKDGDILGFAEVLADRSITLRHLYGETEDINLLNWPKQKWLLRWKLPKPLMIEVHWPSPNLT